MKFLDNFLPDSVDKSSGTLSVSQSGEVNLSYSGNRNCKVINFIQFPFPVYFFITAERIMGEHLIYSYSHLAKIKTDLQSGHPDS